MPGRVDGLADPRLCAGRHRPAGSAAAAADTVLSAPPPTGCNECGRPQPPGSERVGRRKGRRSGSAHGSTHASLRRRAAPLGGQVRIGDRTHGHGSKALFQQGAPSGTSNVQLSATLSQVTSVSGRCTGIRIFLPLRDRHSQLQCSFRVLHAGEQDILPVILPSFSAARASLGLSQHR